MGWRKNKKHMEDKKGGRVLNFDSALFYPVMIILFKWKKKPGEF